MKKENQFTVEFFIDKFKSIPEELWCVGIVKNGNTFCAQGHCMTRWYRESGTDEREIKGTEIYALLDLFEKYFTVPTGYKRTAIVGNINNGDHPDYQQPTPKQRILAALYDIKKLQEKSSPAPQEPPYRTVVIDSNVKSLTESKLQLS